MQIINNMLQNMTKRTTLQKNIDFVFVALYQNTHTMLPVAIYFTEVTLFVVKKYEVDVRYGNNYIEITGKL